MVVIVVLIF